MQTLSVELSKPAQERVSCLEVFDVLDSTSSYLLREEPPGLNEARVAIADYQTAGRGRHDREWLTRPGSSLCLSLGFTFPGTPATLTGITLVMGVATRRALACFGLEDCNLKWPNDIVVHDSKLGGLLAETQLRAKDRVTVIAGIGINLDLPGELLKDSVSAWAHSAIDLKSVLENWPGRDELAVSVINELVAAFIVFEQRGVAAFLDEWRRHDWLFGKTIDVEKAGSKVSGRASGVDDNGSLLVETANGKECIIAGSISVRELEGQRA